jgi:hypothetical protein
VKSKGAWRYWLNLWCNFIKTLDFTVAEADEHYAPLGIRESNQGWTQGFSLDLSTLAVEPLILPQRQQGGANLVARSASTASTSLAVIGDTLRRLQYALVSGGDLASGRVFRVELRVGARGAVFAGQGLARLRLPSQASTTDAVDRCHGRPAVPARKVCRCGGDRPQHGGMDSQIFSGSPVWAWAVATRQQCP